MLEEQMLVPRSAVDWLMRYKPALCEKAGLDRAEPIPNGWQMVPKAPTEEMLLAGMGDDWPEDLYLRDVYELMLEAAPKTPNGRNEAPAAPLAAGRLD